MEEFERFFRASYGQVVRTVALALGDRGRAEEVTQEAFARAFKRWRSVRSTDRPEAWVVVVAINAERRRWRRESKAVDLAPDDTSGDHASSVVARVSLREALGRLTERQRAVVVLRYLADLPFAEIGEALGCAEATARATLHQALAKMRVDLEDGDG